jgi:polysaccharide export outer membrane protein
MIHRRQRYSRAVLLLAIVGWSASERAVASEIAASRPAALPAQDRANSQARLTESPDSAVNNDVERLRELWLKRSKRPLLGDYPIGPGDVIEIAVPAMEELRSHSVRVAGDGTITLPFIGKLSASGLTEEELRAAMVARLREYMHEPRIMTFVKEYRNRQVAVLGAVAKPGVYSLRSENDTILDLLAQAGGIGPGADARIHFIPAEPADGESYQKLAGALRMQSISAPGTTMLLKKTEPIVIDLQELVYGGFQEYLTLNVRPGDVIMVPGGGQILIDGWVARPGAYNVTPGLTVASVVAAAGGLLYPADASAVKIIRTERGGKKLISYSDLEKIKSGREPDLPLQGGDLVEVTAANDRLALYGLYRFFTTVLNVGANIPIR